MTTKNWYQKMVKEEEKNMKSKIEIQEEEQKKRYIYFRNSWFVLKWNLETMLEFGKKVQNTLDKRKDWQNLLSNELQKRMKYIPQKTTATISEIPYNETLEDFISAFKKKVKLREVPHQKSLAEALKK